MRPTGYSLALTSLVLVSALWAQVIVPAPATYPRLEISPATPDAGDTVTLWLVKALHSDGCVPSYTTSYTIETLSQEIYPPNRIIHLTYAAYWLPVGRMCIQVQTEYGPRFTIPDIEVGNYTVKDGDIIVGRLSIPAGVQPAGYTIDGKVTDDPYPTKRATMPVAGAKVYVREQVLWLMESVGPGSAPIAPSVVLDSATTAADGSFSIDGIAAGWYQLSVVAEGYVSQTLGLTLSSDTTLSIALLAEGAPAAVTGTVTRRHDNPALSSVVPVEGCTVTVWAECDGGVYALQASQPVASDALMPVLCPVYTAVTDAEGKYGIDNIPLSRNGVVATVYARAEGFAPETKQARLYNILATQVHFLLQRSFGNRDSIVIDGVVYGITTEKAIYEHGEYLRAKYTVHNQSNKTVTFGGVGPATLCTYSMTLVDQDEIKVYSTADSLACPAIYVEWDLSPGEKDSIDFPPYFLGGDYTGLTVSGQMLGKNDTKVSVDVEVLHTLTATRKSGAASVGTVVRYDAATRCLALRLDRAQTVSVDAFMPSGRRVSGLSYSGFLSAGAHAISLGRRSLGSGVFFVRVKGDGFIETLPLGVMR